jgi:hypothetical protein
MGDGGAEESGAAFLAVVADQFGKIAQREAGAGDQRWRCGERDAETALAGRQAKSQGNMGFANAAVSERNDILTPQDVFPNVVLSCYCLAVIVLCYSISGRAGEKTSQWSGGTVLLRGGVITSHWLG